MAKRNGEPELESTRVPKTPGAHGGPGSGDASTIWRSVLEFGRLVGPLGGGGLLVLPGAMLVVICATWSWGAGTWWGTCICIAGLLAVVSGLLLMTTGVARVRLAAEADCDPRAMSQAHFHRVLIGLGFLFFVVSLLALIGFAGMLIRGLVPASGAEFLERLSSTAPSPTEHAATKGGRSIGALLVVSGMLSLVGASFYVTNSMRLHREADAIGGSEPFRESKFWGGMWFRFGQAVLYTFVFFIVIWSGLPKGSKPAATIGEFIVTLSEQPKESKPAPTIREYMILMPVVGLLIGMFVKTGEVLVLGLADRFSNAVTALIGPPKQNK